MERFRLGLGAWQMNIPELEIILHHTDTDSHPGIIQASSQVVQCFEWVELRRRDLELDGLGNREKRAELYFCLWKWCRLNPLPVEAAASD